MNWTDRDDGDEKEEGGWMARQTDINILKYIPSEINQRKTNIT